MMRIGFFSREKKARHQPGSRIKLFAALQSFA
jgi:hypothetical protein